MTMDEDIAHVARVMVPSLSAFGGEPVLQPAYWRKRLERIQNKFRLTDMQTLKIEHLLRDLDRFETENAASKKLLGPRTPTPWIPRQCGNEAQGPTRYVHRITRVE